MPSASASLDPRALRASLDDEAVGRCQLAALAIASWAAISLGVDARFAEARYGVLAVLHGGLIAAALAAFVLLRRGVLPGRHASLVGFLLWSVQVGAMWLAYASSRELLYPLCVMLELLAAACLHLYGRWVASSAAIAWAGWLVLGVDAPGSSTFAIAFAGSTVIATLIHAVSRRYLVRIEGLRQQDRVTKVQLERALGEARHELDERVRAEAEREALRDQLIHAQRMEAVGTLAGGIAHDMNNVLAAIIGLAEFIKENPAEAGEDVDHLLASARRGADLTRNLLAFSRRGTYRHEIVDPAEVIRGALGLLSRTLPRTVSIETRLGHGAAAIAGDPSQLGQALVNLCINAADAMDGSGRLTVSTTTLELPAERAAALGTRAGPYVALTVTDTGSGMDPATQARIFEPFFTTKPQGKGTGLGLPMVYGTIQTHGGALELSSTVGVGTTFTLYLPRVTGMAGAAAAAASVPLVGSGTLLVVDDDDDVREVIARKLAAAGFEVVQAADGEAGLAAYRARAGEIRLVVLDMLMPVMGGAECFRALQALDPGVRVLIASGYSATGEAQACLAAGALGLLAKPFTAAQLSAAVAQALGGDKLDAAALIAAG